MSEERMEFCGGKYTVIDDNGRLSALRNGEPWGRNLVGDNLIYWMLVDALRISQERDALAAELASVPKEAVERLLTEAMDQAARNGANSVSMPDEYVEIAAWLCNVKPADAAASPARQVGASGSPAADAVEDVRDTFNRVIDHAVDLSLEADQFLRCWREGDWAGCREFGFEADHAKEQSAEAGG